MAELSPTCSVRAACCTLHDSPLLPTPAGCMTPLCSLPPAGCMTPLCSPPSCRLQDSPLLPSSCRLLDSSLLHPPAGCMTPLCSPSPAGCMTPLCSPLSCRLHDSPLLPSLWGSPPVAGPARAEEASVLSSHCSRKPSLASPSPFLPLSFGSSKPPVVIPLWPLPLLVLNWEEKGRA